MLIAWCSRVCVCVFLLIESNLAAKWQFTSFVCLRVAMVDLEREHWLLWEHPSRWLRLYTLLLLHTVLLHSKCLFWKKLCTQIHITMCKNGYLRRQLDCRSYSDQWYSTNHFFSQTDSATHSTTPTELDTACLKPCFRQTLVTSHKLLTRRTHTALIINILIDTVPY